MILYTCDICGEPLLSDKGSVTHVDRYQLGLDLCAKHLDNWIAHGLHLLSMQDRSVPENHGLSRAILDALVVDGSLGGPLNAALPADQPKQPDFNAGLKAVHDVVNAFVEREKAAL